MPRSPVEVHRRFGGTYCLPFQGTIKNIKLKIMKHEQAQLPKQFLIAKSNISQLNSSSHLQIEMGTSQCFGFAKSLVLNTSNSDILFQTEEDLAFEQRSKALLLVKYRN
jgi:hypothetical protein